MTGAPGAAGSATGNRVPGAAGTAGAAGAMGPGAGMAGGQGNMQRMAPLTLENYRVRDLWDHKDLTLKETSMYIEIPPHAVKVYRFIRK
jgi:hypothetical protein